VFLIMSLTVFFLNLSFRCKIAFLLIKKANFMMKLIKTEKKRYTIRLISTWTIEWLVFEKNVNPSYIFFLFLAKRKKKSSAEFSVISIFDSPTLPRMTFTRAAMSCAEVSCHVHFPRKFFSPKVNFAES